MIDATRSWAYPFIASLALLFLGSLLALRLRPDLPFTAEEPTRSGSRYPSPAPADG
jgi:hypothetical protein